MKALTVWQPWASLIILGLKPYEFRKWSAHKSVIGQRIAIHAGARQIKIRELDDIIERMEGGDRWTTGLHAEALPLIKEWRDDTSKLWRSAVLGTAVLGKPISGSEIAHEFGGPVNDSDRSDHANFAWPMLDVQPWSPPVPTKGAQGFWNFHHGEQK